MFGLRTLALAAVFAAFAAPAWAQADLTVEMYGRSDRLGGETYRIGQPLLFSFDVLNRGDAVAPGTNTAGANGYMVDIIISTDATAPVQFAVFSATFREDALLRGGRMSRTPDIAPGARAPWHGSRMMLGSPPAPYDYLQFDLPTGMRPGRYYLCIQVDPGRRITESNELNNTTCMAMTLVAAPPIPRPPLPRPTPLPTPRPG